MTLNVQQRVVAADGRLTREGYLMFLGLQSTGGGGGDMLKATYDADNDSVVDNAEALQGQAGAFYLARGNHSGTQVAATISDFSTAADARVAVGIAAHVALADPHPGYLTPAEGNAAYSALGHTHPQSDVTGLVADLAAKQGLDGTLTALAGLNGTAGLVEQTGADTFTKRALGVAAATDVLTRGDGDGRFAALSHNHVAANVTDFNEAAQDAVGAMLDASLTYVDATPLLQRAALTGAITAAAGSNATALGSFTTAQLNTALSDGDVATGGGTATGTNTGDQSLFRTIVVAGQSDVVADTTTDTLTLVAGTNVTITTNAGTDTITIAASGGGGSSNPFAGYLL